MPVIEQTAQQLVLKSGSTTLTLDKRASRAVLQRRLLFWNLKPAQALLGDITDVGVETAVDRASGVEVCSTMLTMRSGAAWIFPSSDKKDAQSNADAIRNFVGIARPAPED